MLSVALSEVWVEERWASSGRRVGGPQAGCLPLEHSALMDGE